MVVDDEAEIRNFLKIRLVGWGYHMVTAASGQAGIAAIQENAPDMVLTDLYMSDGDGFDLLAYVEKTLPDLPVIVLSGQGQLGDVIRALRLGAWDYINKPIEQAAILRLAIEKALEKARLIQENREHHDHLEELVARKSAQLQASENRYRTVADFTHDWEYWLGTQGTLHYISPSCERVTGYSAREFAEKPELLQEILHADDLEAFAAHLVPDALTDGVCSLDFRIIRKDGHERWIGHRCQEVRGGNGEYLGRRCSNRDITYQKDIESNLVRKHHELLNKTIHLEKAKNNLEKANTALKSLLDQRETEKRSIEQTMVANLKRFVFPYLKELGGLKIGDEARTYTQIIRANIEQLISPVSKTLSGAYLELTPTEVKVADLIRQGESTKSIAAFMNTSTSTVAIHRNNIRRKLNLLNKKVNLHTYLNSLA